MSFWIDLLVLVIPRIRDFRGVSTKAFDAQGNYTLGIKDQSIFPEINLDTLEFNQGMNVTIVVKNSKSAKESFVLLKKLGMPFKKDDKK